MKVLGIIALVISLVGLAAGIYCQVEYVPKMDQADLFGPELFVAYSDAKFFWGSIALFAGIPGFLLGLIAAIKKVKIAWAAVLFGLVSTVLGLMQATHMFS